MTHRTYKVFRLCVDHSIEEKAPELDKLKEPERNDDVEIGEEDGGVDGVGAYLAEGHLATEKDVTLSRELGLAIEALPDGFTAKDLWTVI